MAKKVVKRSAKKSAVRKTSGLKESLNKNRKAPTGVKIIYILNYIGAIFAIALALILLIVGIALISNPNLINLNEVIEKAIEKNPTIPEEGLKALSLIVGNLGIICLIASVFFVLFGILGLFVAKGLKHGKNWARIVEMVFAALGVLSFISNLFAGRFNGLIRAIIYAVIFYYLAFNKEAQKFFGR